MNLKHLISRIWAFFASLLFVIVLGTESFADDGLVSGQLYKPGDTFVMNYAGDVVFNANYGCAAGSYVPKGGTECVKCPAGYYCLADAQPVLCPAGRYCLEGTETAEGTGPVAAGYYNLGGGTSPTPTMRGNGCVNELTTQCGTIAPGFWGAAGATQYVGSGKVDAGYFSTGGATSATPTASDCVGKVANINDEGRLVGVLDTNNTCGLVAAGYWNNGAGISATGATSTGYEGGQVSAGYYSTGGATMSNPSSHGFGCVGSVNGVDTSCGLIEAGYYSTGGGTSATPSAAGNGCLSGYSCGKVAAGYYSTGGATTAQGQGVIKLGLYSTCGATSQGDYGGALADKDYLDCVEGCECGRVAAGYYSTGGGTTAQGTCLGGYDCGLTAAGYYSRGGAGSAKASGSQCWGYNKYSDGIGGCGQVSAGYYSTGGAKTAKPTSLEDCAGDSSCGLCEAGYYCSVGSSSAQQNACPAPYSNSAAGAAAEADCYLTTTGGTYVQTAKGTPVTCPVDNYCPAGEQISYGETGGNYPCDTGYTTGGATGMTECMATGNVITLNMDGGSILSGTGASGNISCTVESDAIVLPTPTKTGYTFVGWFDKQTGGTKVTEIAAGSCVVDKTFYAHWTPIKYTVTYNANKPSAASGTVSGTTANSTHTYDVAGALTTNGFSLTGWVFTGWNTKADGKGTAYTNGASVKNLSATNGATVTLYAIWERSIFTITLNKGNNATGGTSSVYFSPNAAMYLDNAGTKVMTGTANPITVPSYSYEVSYDANGGNVSVATSNKDAKYKLDGYYMDAASGAQVILPTGYVVDSQSANITSTKTSDFTIYARWSGGSVVLPAATRANYTFAGWYDSAALTNRVGNAGDTFTPGKAGVKLYAKWTANKYTISFNANGGNIMSGAGASGALECTVEETVAKLPAPVKTGYSFAGWYQNQELTGDAIDSIAKGACSADYELYAAWNANTFNVAYANGGGTGSGPTSPLTCTYDGDCVAPQNTYTKAGYEFNGWKCTSDNGACKNGTYMPGDSIATATDVDGATITLKAEWKLAGDSTITFDSAGGTIKDTDYVTACNAASQTVVLPTNVVKTGYIFDGWFDKQTDGTKVTEIAAGSCVEDKTFYAYWTPITYTIVFEPNAPENASGLSGARIAPKKSTYTYGVEGVIKINSAHLVGWNFKGFNTKADGTGISYPYDPDNLTKVLNWASSQDAEITLYAQWEPTERELTWYYQENSDEEVPDMPTSCLYDNMFTLPEGPSRVGYTFDGWRNYSGNDATYYVYKPGSEVICAPGKIRYDFTATWIRNEFNVAYSGGEGSGDSPTSPVKCGYESKCAAPENTYTRPGYIFAGWACTSSNGTCEKSEYKAGDSIATATGVDGATITLTATWKVGENNKIELDVAGGTVDDASFVYSCNVESSVKLPTKVTKTGYKFVGWYNAEGKQVSTIAEGECTSDMSFTAKWRANTYYVEFDTNGGDISAGGGRQTLKYGTSAELTGALMTNGTKQFLGWSPDENAITAKYTNNEIVLNLSATDGDVITLYAVWVDCPACAAGTGATCTLSAPLGVCTYQTACKEHYSGLKNTGTATPSCEAVKYTLTYTKNDGNYTDGFAPVTQCSIEDGKIVLPNASQIVKENYQFDGWYDNAGFSGSPITELSACDANRILHAKWTKVTEDCVAGQYYNGSTFATCPKGWYCQGKGKATIGFEGCRASCPEGYTDGDAGISSQEQCQIEVPQGSYLPTAKSAQTSVCQAGKYTSAAVKVAYGETSSCTACEAGSYCESGTKYSCASKTNNVFTNSVASSDSINDCYVVVAAGKYVESNTVKTCEAPYYCPGVSQVFYGDEGGRKLCSELSSVVEWQSAIETDGASTPEKCFVSVDAGKYWNGTDFETCAAGTYKEQHDVYYGQSSTCSQCPSGFTSGSGTETIDMCYSACKMYPYATKMEGVEYYSGANTCQAVECEVGYILKNGMCGSCPANNICDPNYDAGKPYLCYDLTGGKYTMSEENSVSVSACYLVTTAGNYVEKAGQGERTCKAGDYCSGGDKVMYAGTKSTGGNESCSKFGEEYSSAVGATVETQCRKACEPDETKNALKMSGFDYYGTDETDTCEVATCQAGFYLVDGKCEMCTEGFVCDPNKQNGAPIACSALTGGLYVKSNSGAGSVDECYLTTTAGKYVAQAKQPQATCPAGSYCREGLTVHYGETNEPVSCPAAYAESDAGAVAAEACYKVCEVKGNAQEVSGRDYYGTEVADTCTVATCKPGYTLDAYGKCVTCPENHICDPNKQNGTPIACSVLTTWYTKSAEGSSMVSECYLDTEIGMYVAKEATEQIICAENGFCEGGSRIYYGSTGGRIACSSDYPNADEGSNNSDNCYRTCAMGDNAYEMSGRDYHGNGKDTCAIELCQPGYTLSAGACRTCPENAICRPEYGKQPQSCSVITDGMHMFAKAGSDEDSDCYTTCEIYEIVYGKAIPVSETEFYPAQCQFYGVSKTGNPCDIVDGKCEETSCNYNFEMVGGVCKACERENALSYKQSGGNCIVETCVTGYHPNGQTCEVDVIECSAPNAVYAERAWDVRKQAFGECVISECAEGYHLDGNVCQADEQICVVEHGVGIREWNHKTNKWGDCIATKCDPGYTNDSSQTNELWKQCGRCNNMYSAGGELAASSYVEGCEIATCMYEGELYTLENNECILICDTYSDETGSRKWNASRKKCERTCAEGYREW